MILEIKGLNIKPFVSIWTLDITRDSLARFLLCDFKVSRKMARFTLNHKMA